MMAVSCTKSFCIGDLSVIGAILVTVDDQTEADAVVTRSRPYKLLVLDAAYSLRAVRERGLEHSVRSRDLDGFFNHVWSVHPLVGADPSEREDAIGVLTTVRLDARHTVVEGRIGRFRRLRDVPTLNFLISQISLFVALHRLIRHNGISAVRAGDPYYLGLMGLLLAKVNRLPFVVRVNGNYDAIFAAIGQIAYPRIFRRRSIEKRIDRFVLSRADFVAAPNRDNLRFAIANGAAPERTTVFPYGNLVHPLHFDRPEERQPVGVELGLGSRRFVVVVGRLEPVKHPMDVLEAFLTIHRTHPDVAVVFIGDGSLRPALEKCAADRGLLDRSYLVGNRDQGWVARALSEAALVLAPMSGRALVEAMLAGSAVVAYDVDWHSEVVEDGVTGLLVPFRDPEAMGSAATRLLSSPKEAGRLGDQARVRIRTTMEPAALAAAERAVYTRLFSRD